MDTLRTHTLTRAAGAVEAVVRTRRTMRRGVLLRTGTVSEIVTGTGIATVVTQVIDEGRNINIAS